MHLSKITTRVIIMLLFVMTLSSCVRNAPQEERNYVRTKEFTQEQLEVINLLSSN